MNDFQGKISKVYLNAESGWLVMTGPFIRAENDFIIIKNKMDGKIEYLSKGYIKYIEILKDIEADRKVEEDDE